MGIVQGIHKCLQQQRVSLLFVIIPMRVQRKPQPVYSPQVISHNHLYSLRKICFSRALGGQSPCLSLSLSLSLSLVLSFSCSLFATSSHFCTPRRLYLFFAVPLGHTLQFVYGNWCYNVCNVLQQKIERQETVSSLPHSYPFLPVCSCPCPCVILLLARLTSCSLITCVLTCSQNAVYTPLRYVQGNIKYPCPTLLQIQFSKKVSASVSQTIIENPPHCPPPP